MLFQKDKGGLRVISLALIGEMLSLLVIQSKFVFDADLSSVETLSLLGLMMLFIACLSFFMFFFSRRLDQTDSLMFSVMLILACFAYPLKQLWIYYSPDIVSVYFYSATRTDWSESAVAGYLVHEYLALIALTLGVILAGLLSRARHAKQLFMANAGYVSRGRSWICAVCTFLLMAGLLLAMKSVGMYMGAGGISLPFHLAGLILYSHLILVPVLLLLALIYWPNAPFSKKFVAFMVFTFLCYILGDMFVRLSRSSLLVVMMLIIGFFTVYRPWLLRRFFLLGGVAIIATVVLLPLVTTLRMASVYDNWSPSYLQKQYTFYSEITSNLILMRITGAESASLALTNLKDHEYNSLQVFSRGMTEFYTREILGVPDEGKTGFTPSALGEVEILFGGIGVIGVIMLWPLVLLIINQGLRSRLGFLYPVGFAFLFAFAIKSVSGGIYFKDITTLAGAVGILLLIKMLSRVRVSSMRNANMVGA